MLICATWDLEVLGQSLVMCELCVFMVLDAGTARICVQSSVQLDLQIVGIRLAALFLIL